MLSKNKLTILAVLIMCGIIQGSIPMSTSWAMDIDDNTSICPISKLPEEKLVGIFLWLSPVDTARTTQVSQQWERVSKDTIPMEDSILRQFQKWQQDPFFYINITNISPGGGIMGFNMAAKARRILKCPLVKEQEKILHSLLLRIFSTFNLHRIDTTHVNQCINFIATNSFEKKAPLIDQAFLRVSNVPEERIGEALKIIDDQARSEAEVTEIFESIVPKMKEFIKLRRRLECNKKY